MKNIFKKGLVVLLASLFVTSVFAAEATTAKTTVVEPAHHVVKHVTHCKKKCHKAANGKKVCKKNCKVHHKVMMKKAEAPSNMKQAEAQTGKVSQ